MATSHAKEDAHDTRQLLDELDALMNQMLALPVDESEDGAASVAAEFHPTVSATLTLLEPADRPTEADRESPSTLSFDRSMDPGPQASADAITWPVNSSAADAQRQPCAEEPTPRVLMAQLTPDPLNLAPLPAKVPASRWAKTNVGYHFLLWVNQGYDHGASWFGAPGRVMGSRSGKATLGMLGLALILLALGWLGLDWLGW